MADIIAASREGEEVSSLGLEPTVRKLEESGVTLQFEAEGWRVLFVCLGAFVGALLRWKIQVSFNDIDPKWTRWATLGINACGSLLLGAIAALGTTNASPITLTIGVGFCGSFTTFSTYAVDVVKLFDGDKAGDAVLLVVLSNTISICAAAFSYMLTKRGLTTTTT